MAHQDSLESGWSVRQNMMVVTRHCTLSQLWLNTSIAGAVAVFHCFGVFLESLFYAPFQFSNLFQTTHSWKIL